MTLVRLSNTVINDPKLLFPIIEYFLSNKENRLLSVINPFARRLLHQSAARFIQKGKLLGDASLNNIMGGFDDSLNLFISAEISSHRLALSSLSLYFFNGNCTWPCSTLIRLCKDTCPLVRIYALSALCEILDSLLAYEGDAIDSVLPHISEALKLCGAQILSESPISHLSPLSWAVLASLVSSVSSLLCHERGRVRDGLLALGKFEASREQCTLLWQLLQPCKCGGYLMKVDNLSGYHLAAINLYELQKAMTAKCSASIVLMNPAAFNNSKDLIQKLATQLTCESEFVVVKKSLMVALQEFFVRGISVGKGSISPANLLRALYLYLDRCRELPSFPLNLIYVLINNEIEDVRRNDALCQALNDRIFLLMETMAGGSELEENEKRESLYEDSAINAKGTKTPLCRPFVRSLVISGLRQYVGGLVSVRLFPPPFPEAILQRLLNVISLSCASTNVYVCREGFFLLLDVLDWFKNIKDEYDEPLLTLFETQLSVAVRSGLDSKNTPILQALAMKCCLALILNGTILSQPFRLFEKLMGPLLQVGADFHRSNATNLFDSAEQAMLPSCRESEARKLFLFRMGVVGRIFISLGNSVPSVDYCSLTLLGKASWCDLCALIIFERDSSFIAANYSPFMFSRGGWHELTDREAHNIFEESALDVISFVTSCIVREPHSFDLVRVFPILKESIKTLLISVQNRSIVDKIEFLELFDSKFFQFWASHMDLSIVELVVWLYSLIEGLPLSAKLKFASQIAEVAHIDQKIDILVQSISLCLSFELDVLPEAGLLSRILPASGEGISFVLNNIRFPLRWMDKRSEIIESWRFYCSRLNSIDPFICSIPEILRSQFDMTLESDKRSTAIELWAIAISSPFSESLGVSACQTILKLPPGPLKEMLFEGVKRGFCLLSSDLKHEFACRLLLPLFKDILLHFGDPWEALRPFVSGEDGSMPSSYIFRFIATASGCLEGGDTLLLMAAKAWPKTVKNELTLIPGWIRERVVRQMRAAASSVDERDKQSSKPKRICLKSAF